MLHNGFVGGENCTGDIPYIEMPVDLQPVLYGIGKVHDLHVEYYIKLCIFRAGINMSVKYSGQFPLMVSWTIFVVLKYINCCILINQQIIC